MIIYKDKNILAVNKPAGLLVHKAQNLKQKTLVDWLIQNYPEVKTVGDEPGLRPGIAHRLDKDTSGILIIARNQETFEFLKEQFSSRQIKKTYIALVKGEIKDKQGVINTPIKRFTKSRDAITEYRIIERFDEYTLLEVSPKTGRTHQIRIHLKSIGHPVACDKMYSKHPSCPFGLKRHFLHASGIEFSLPKGKRIKLEAGLPDDLKNCLNKLRKCGK